MIAREPVVINSVEPLEGREGTIVTLRGSGFARHIRNNCVVIGGMGACARAEPDSTPTELRVRIGPVARETAGDLLMWPGTGTEVFTESLGFGRTRLAFSEVAIFRNGAPTAAAGIDFRLVEASPYAYAGHFEESAKSRVDLGGLENAAVMRVPLPTDFTFAAGATVDLCLVLKEPTLAIDITAEISGESYDSEECIRSIAKSINVHGLLIGEKVFADVARNEETGELELYVTKPYLENGMATLHFSAEGSAAS